MKFREELESYSKQIDEFDYWGDVTEIAKYQKKAQTLDNRLNAALEKIDKFNEEEKSFEWAITRYPLRKELADRLSTYKKLYDTGYEFLTKYEKWNNAPIGTYDPDDIDGELNAGHR